MENKDNLIYILDSVLDDYYLLWECFSEYSQWKTNETNPLVSFSISLKEAQSLEFIHIYEGTSFKGEEILLPKFSLTDSVIEQLLNWKDDRETEIRITTSKEGANFLTL
jgi:hypothetical protein